MSAFARVAVPARTRPVPASVPVLGRHDPRRSCRGVDASVATVSGRRALPRAPRRASVVTRAASSSGAPGGKDLYELLDVSTTATPKEIKSAYKKAALKYHPDVNKAPDAAERFNEVKSAYQTLSDPDARRRYDLLRAGGGARARPSDPFSSGFGASARARSGPGPTPGAGRASARPQDEPFYGFSDFWRDVEKEFEAFEKSRPDPGKPRTLWEELGALGEEFVDFLEESAFEAASTTRDPFTGETTTKRTRYSSSSSEGKDGNGGSRSSTYSSTTTTSRSYSTSSGSGGAGSAGAGASRAPPKRESVDEMLEKMKRDMGLK